MPLTIAMISYHTCPLASLEGKETGGMNVYVLELSKSLARLGHTVHIFTRRQELSNPPVVEIEKNVTLFHVPAGPDDHVDKKQLIEFVAEFADNVYDVMSEQEVQYDIMHCHYYMSGVVGQLLRKKIDNAGSKTVTPKMVMTFHTLALMKNLIARDEKEKDGDVRINAELDLAKTVDRVVAPSESDAQYLEYLYGAPSDRITVIPPGVDVDLFRPINKVEAKQHIGADVDHHLILSVGRIEPLKGIDVLMYAIKILVTKNPNTCVCLWVVGGDISQPKQVWSKELQKLEKLRDQLGLATYVRLVGQKNQIELPYYYNAAEVVVMPSHYESFGMAAAEAMACGTPVITTNVSGISMLIDEHHQSLITSVNNPLLLASQIEDVLRQKTKLSSEKLRNTITDLNWPNIAEQMAQVYEEVIEKGT